MQDKTETTSGALCPSAQPDMDNSFVFGVVGGTVDQPLLGYLVKPQPVTEELLALSGPVHLTEVFRFAASCATSKCQHFDGINCNLATRTVQLLPKAVSDLPKCVIRASCQCWLQEGREACLRCPQVVTQSHNPTELQRQAADHEH
jgi:hypothetical protein